MNREEVKAKVEETIAAIHINGDTFFANYKEVTLSDKSSDPGAKRYVFNTRQCAESNHALLKEDPDLKKIGFSRSKWNDVWQIQLWLRTPDGAESVKEFIHGLNGKPKQDADDQFEDLGEDDEGSPF